MIEAELANAWTLENLAVYGDHLISLGDPRGELIAVDVHIARHGATPELAHRRRRALREWLQLPIETDPTRGIWEAAKFAFGFVEDLRGEIAMKILQGPAGPFVRSVTLSQRTPLMQRVLHELAAAPRAWLDRLTIVSRGTSRLGTAVWSGDKPCLRAIPGLIEATPRLRVFELAGHRMMTELAHPAVKRMRIDGIDAFLPILEAGDPMPALADLELTFARGIDERVVMQRPWPALLPAANFPSLTRLDLSENWLPATTDTQVAAFDVLPELGVLPQLEELRLWGVYDAREQDILRRLVTRMPHLRVIELEHDRHALQLPGIEIKRVPMHWPRDAGALTAVWAVVPGFSRIELPLASLCRHCHHARSWLSPDAYEAWQVVWQNIEALPYGADNEVSSTVMRRALDGLGFLDGSFPGLTRWIRLREHLRALDGEVPVRLTMMEP